MGDIDGVKILEELTIKCHRLFVDDVGVFNTADEHSFAKLKEALSLYKMASRAKLNLEKLQYIHKAGMQLPT